MGTEKYLYRLDVNKATIYIDLQALCLYINGKRQEINLSGKPLKLFLFLAGNCGQLLENPQILNRFSDWLNSEAEVTTDGEIVSKVVSEIHSALRSSICDAVGTETAEQLLGIPISKFRCIRTIKGVGYKFQAAEVERPTVEALLTEKTAGIGDHNSNLSDAPPRKILNVGGRAMAFEERTKPTETGFSQLNRFALEHNMPPILDRYIPRTQETIQLKEKLDHGHKQVFIWGQGGVGKTEFVISFANQFSDIFECFFATFKDNIEETILGLNFDGWSAYEQTGGKNATKPREQQYAEKLALLRRLNKNCLLIVDNADIHPEQLLTDPKWRDLERLDVRQLFTTRYEFDKANLLIEPFLKEQLYDYLQEYYISQFSFCKRNVLELIDAVERHTLTIDILGRLLKASKGCITPKDVLKALKENNANTDWLAVTSEYNRDYAKRSIYDHLQTVFNLAGLSANELYLMQCASVVSLDGMDAKFFADAIGSEYAELLDKLCEAGWVRRRDNQKVSLHPLIRSVIFYGNETQTTWSKIERFATSLLKKCQYTDVSFFFKENFCVFPAAAVYMCLSNITQLPDIPDAWLAEICETLAWELYFLNERITSKDSVAINFLSRCMLLNTALDCRENIEKANRAGSTNSIAIVTKDLSALAGVWYKMGCLFANHFDHHEDARDAFHKAADILTECQEPNYFLIADCYGYAAYACCQLEIFDQAMLFLKMARSAFQKADEKRCEIYYPDRLPPTCFGFSYPEAKPKEIWGFFEANDENWSFTYTVERIQNRYPVPLLINGSYKIRIDPNR